MIDNRIMSVGGTILMIEKYDVSIVVINELYDYKNSLLIYRLKLMFLKSFSLTS